MSWRLAQTSPRKLIARSHSWSRGTALNLILGEAVEQGAGFHLATEIGFKPGERAAEERARGVLGGGARKEAIGFVCAALLAPQRVQLQCISRLGHRLLRTEAELEAARKQVLGLDKAPVVER